MEGGEEGQRRERRRGDRGGRRAGRVELLSPRACGATQPAGLCGASQPAGLACSLNLCSSSVCKMCSESWLEARKRQPPLPPLPSSPPFPRSLSSLRFLAGSEYDDDVDEPCSEMFRWSSSGTAWPRCFSACGLMRCFSACRFRMQSQPVLHRESVGESQPMLTQ